MDRRVISRFSRLTLLVDVRYESGRFYQNDAGTYGRASNFTTAGIAGMTLYQQVEIQAGITNLFDRNYILVDGYPEAGLMVYINMRYRF